MPLLQMKHICKSFSGVYANEDINLTVEKGEIHALLGENGAGKTTLMNISRRQRGDFLERSAGEFYITEGSDCGWCRDGTAAFFSGQ